MSICVHLDIEAKVGRLHPALEIATVRSGIKPGQLPSQVGSTPERETLVADNAEGEAGKDWRQGPKPLAVCHIADGRGGYSETTVQDHPWPNFTVRATGTSAAMIVATFAEMETV